MYPPAIESILVLLEQAFQESDFYQAVDTTPQMVNKLFGKLLFDKWCKGDELVITEEEFEETTQRCVMEHALESLAEKGLVGTYDDPEKGPMVFLTTKGLQYVDQWRDSEDPPVQSSVKKF